MIKNVDKLILRDLTSSVLFGIGIFFIILVMGVLLNPAMEFMVRYNLPLSLFLEYFCLGLPQAFVYAVPMGVLLGTLLAYARLSGDFEVTGALAAGVSLFRLIAPALAISIFFAAVLLFLNEVVVPYSNRAAKDLRNQVKQRQKGAVFQQELVLSFFNNAGKLKWLLVAAELKGNVLTNIKFHRYGDSIDDYTIIEAQKGIWTKNKWEFFDCRIITPQKDGNVYTFFSKNMNVPDLKLDNREIAISTFASEDRSLSEQYRYIRSMIREGGSSNDIRKETTSLWFKITGPFLPIVFVLLGAPLGIVPQRTSNSTGFGIALLIVFVYYVLIVVCTNFSRSGVFNPILAAWLPNILIGGAGSMLIRRKSRAG